MKISIFLYDGYLAKTKEYRISTKRPFREWVLLEKFKVFRKFRWKSRKNLLICCTAICCCWWAAAAAVAAAWAAAWALNTCAVSSPPTSPPSNTSTPPSAPLEYNPIIFTQTLKYRPRTAETSIKLDDKQTDCDRNDAHVINKDSFCQLSLIPIWKAWKTKHCRKQWPDRLLNGTLRKSVTRLSISVLQFE